MNLESQPSKKNQIPQDDFSFDDFDFKPITSGLGFTQASKTTEIKPTFVERQMTVHAPVSPAPVKKKDNSFYQSDLSAFYGNQVMAQESIAIHEQKAEEITYRLASKKNRTIAYLLDLALIVSCLGIMLTIMSRSIGFDLMDTWSTYPNEITPLIVILFCGFYLLYFSIFEKTAQSTLGKSFFNMRVVTLDNTSASFTVLCVRSTVSLLNFVSLGLFSYFDLQNKISDSKVVKLK